MKLASFIANGAKTWGIIDGDIAFAVGEVLADEFIDLKAMIAAGAFDRLHAAKASAKGYSISEIRWLPVIPNPDKVLCVGLNYETHRKETGRKEVAHPTIFTRFANSQTSHLQPIRRPRVSTHLDFEGELAVIIGQPGRYISRQKAWDHIAGYACYNDASVRDWQSHTHQFTPGKNFPETGSFGPWMCTPEELGELSGLRIQTRLNGKVVQEALLGDMIFDIPTVIEYCSTFTRLESGDVISTGTPGGVGVKRDPPLWMKQGDVVEVEIDRLGVLRNSVEDES